MRNKLIKKTLFIVSFLCLAIVASLFYNYRTTGVFIMAKKSIPIYCVDTKEKKIAISFDTSWGTDCTDKILEVLDKHKVKATFFVIGTWMDQYPEKVKEIHKRGHEIGNHTNTHPDMTRISKDKMVQEIAITDAKIKELTAQDTNLFRCPSGAYNDNVLQVVESTGHYCVQWNVDSIDWKEQGADLEFNRVIKKASIGSIILFHNNAKYTPENLCKIIEKFQNQGYSFVKVGDLIYKDNYHLDINGKQVLNP